MSFPEDLFRDLGLDFSNGFETKPNDPTASLQEQLTELNDIYRTILQQRKQLENELERKQEQLSDWNTQARKALSRGNETDARNALKKKKEDMVKIETIRENIDKLHTHEKRIQAQRDMLKTEIERRSVH